MPIYEYFCEDCQSGFESLRRVERAVEPAPCPTCDADSRRIMPTSFEAFTFRDGTARSLPDLGRFRHLGKEVSSPITGTALPGEHPELAFDKHGPGTPPTIEEMERFEQQMTGELEQQVEEVASGKTPVIDTYREQRTGEFVKRVRKTANQARLRKIKQPNAKTTPRTRSGKHGLSRSS